MTRTGRPREEESCFTQETPSNIGTVPSRRSCRPPSGSIDRVDDLRDRRDRLAAERAIDDVLADSFPASDPPSWNPGVTRLSLDSHLTYRASGHTPITDAGERDDGFTDVVDVSRQTRGGRTFLQALASLAGAAGIALAVPFVILLIGLPVALAVRGVLEARWLGARRHHSLNGPQFAALIRVDLEPRTRAG